MTLKVIARWKNQPVVLVSADDVARPQLIQKIGLNLMLWR